MFECAANGSESLIISWIRNNELLSNSKSNKIQNDGNKSILKIKEATVDNSGIYQCIATNADNEEVLSKPAELLSKIHETIISFNMCLYLFIIQFYHQ